MGGRIRFRSGDSPDCRFVFLRKAAVYCAGTTFMSFFAIEAAVSPTGRVRGFMSASSTRRCTLVGRSTTSAAIAIATPCEIEASIVI